MPSTELRTYFGPVAAPLYGAWHLPASGAARGTVLLVPPLAKEQYAALRGLRRLGDLLADAGLAVLRYDHLGTGDSAGPSGAPDAVAGWVESVRVAAAYARATGPGEPAVVALGVGAALVAAAGLTPPALVRWAPETGRRFARGQAALAALAGLDTVGDVRAWVGLDLHRDAIAALAALPSEPPTAPRVLDVDDDGLDAYLRPAAHLVRNPDSAIARIAAWLDTTIQGPAVTVDPEIRTRARLGEAEERIEWIEGAAAIRTVPVDGAPARGVLLCATANDTRHGPNRAWVDLARAVAARGCSTVRFDRRGAGESGPVDAGEAVPLFPPTGVDDAVAAARTLDGPLLTAGVCSGSWYAAHAARATAADAAVLVNAVLYSWRLKPGLNATPDLGVPRSDPAFTRSARGRAKDLLRRGLPYPAWRALGRRGVTQVPEVLLAPVARGGTAVSLVLAPPDAHWFDEQRGREGLRSRGLRDTVRVERVGTGDHPAHHPAVRAAVAREILRWCTPQ